MLCHRQQVVHSDVMRKRGTLALALSASLVLAGCTSSKVTPLCPGDDAKTTEQTSPDGRIVWSSQGRTGPCIGIYAMHPDGTNVHRLTRFAFEYFYLPQKPRQSPDGRLISFIGQCGDEEKPEPDLCVMNADGSGARTVASSDLDAVIDLRDAPSWSPDGTHLAFARSPAAADDFTMSVHIIGIDGRGERIVVPQAYEPTWSPDGSRLAVVSEREGTRKIYLVDVDGSNLTRLTDGPNDANPAWAPDGERIAFESERAGKRLVLGNAAERDPALARGILGGSRFVLGTIFFVVLLAYMVLRRLRREPNLVLLALGPAELLILRATFLSMHWRVIDEIGRWDPDEIEAVPGPEVLALNLKLPTKGLLDLTPLAVSRDASQISAALIDAGVEPKGPAAHSAGCACERAQTVARKRRRVVLLAASGSGHGILRAGRQGVGP